MAHHLDRGINRRIRVVRNGIGVRVLHCQQHRAKWNQCSQHIGRFLILLDGKFVEVGQGLKLVKLAVVQRVDALAAGRHAHPESVLERHPYTHVIAGLAESVSVEIPVRQHHRHGGVICPVGVKQFLVCQGIRSNNLHPVGTGNPVGFDAIEHKALVGAGSPQLHPVGPLGRCGSGERPFDLCRVGALLIRPRIYIRDWREVGVGNGLG